MYRMLKIYILITVNVNFKTSSFVETEYFIDVNNKYYFISKSFIL